jgi:hypothetical protein
MAPTPTEVVVALPADRGVLQVANEAPPKPLPTLPIPTETALQIKARTDLENQAAIDAAKAAQVRAKAEADAANQAAIDARTASKPVTAQSPAPAQPEASAQPAARAPLPRPAPPTATPPPPARPTVTPVPTATELPTAPEPIVEMKAPVTFEASNPPDADADPA